MHPMFLIIVLVICVIIVFILADIQSRKIPTTFPEELKMNEEDEEDEENEEDEEDEMQEDEEELDTDGEVLDEKSNEIS